MASAPSIHNEDVPPGWSNDALAIQKLVRAQDFSELTNNKIRNPIGLLVRSGEDVLLFQDGDDYYVWDPVASVLDKVLSPKDMSSVLQRLSAKDGHYALDRIAVELAD